MQPQPEGGTLRDSFRLYAQAMGKRHPEDRAPLTPPASIFYLYGWFHETSRGRPIAGSGTMLPIPPSETLAWCRLNRRELLDWELECLLAMDAAFLRVMAEKV